MHSFSCNIGACSYPLERLRGASRQVFDCVAEERQAGRAADTIARAQALHHSPALSEIGESCEALPRRLMDARTRPPPVNTGGYHDEVHMIGHEASSPALDIGGRARHRQEVAAGRIFPVPEGQACPPIVALCG